MKYYLRHFLEGWIVEFDDEAKKFGLYLKGEIEDFEANELDVIDGKEVYENTEGMVTRKGREKFKKINVRKPPAYDIRGEQKIYHCICVNAHSFGSATLDNVVCPQCKSDDIDFIEQV